MTKLSKLIINTGNYNQRRFLTSADMSIIKHDEAVRNAKEKRGELKVFANRYISICGCGVVGCAIHNSYPNPE